jgi:hypothetical protein
VFFQAGHDGGCAAVVGHTFGGAAAGVQSLDQLEMGNLKVDHAIDGNIFLFHDPVEDIGLHQSARVPFENIPPAVAICFLKLFLNQTDHDLIGHQQALFKVRGY